MTSSAQEFLSCIQNLHQYLASKLTANQATGRTVYTFNECLILELKSVRENQYLLEPDNKDLSNVYKKLEKLATIWGDYGGEEDEERRKLLHLMEKLVKVEKTHGINLENRVWEALSEKWRKQ